MKTKSQKGFSIIEGLLILVIVGIIGGAGWYVWNANKKTNENFNNANTSSNVENNAGKKIESKATTRDLGNGFKEYANEDPKFSFRYLNSWKITDIYSDNPDGSLGGTVDAISPAGLKVSIGVNVYTGKGGSCEEDPTDRPHNTKNCSTLEFLYTKDLKIGNNTNVQLVRYKYTEARDGSGKVPVSEYGFNLNDYRAFNNDTSKPMIGAWFGGGNFMATDEIGVDTYIQGLNNKTPDFFNHKDAKDAEALLSSLRVGS